VLGYRRILVALDGSTLAECALPHVAMLAQVFGAAVTLLRVVTPRGPLVAEVPEGALQPSLPAPVPPASDVAWREVTEYLGILQARLRAEGIFAACSQCGGRAADAIVAEAQRVEADVIIVATHGRGELGRLVLGSVADEVLRRAPCPVLVLRPTDRTPSTSAVSCLALTGRSRRRHRSASCATIWSDAGVGTGTGKFQRRDFAPHQRSSTIAPPGGTPRRVVEAAVALVEDQAANRRVFLARLATALGAFLGAAAGVPLLGAAIAPALRRDEPGWIALGAPSDFGGAPRLVTFGVTKTDGYQRTTIQRGVWIYRPDDAEPIIYNARCTHLGCLASYRADSQTFLCPCHGGVFGLADGRVLEGPPPRPLDRLEYRLEGDRLLVQYRDFLVGVPEQMPL
jgi:menaquinol-cytochrome c reductase iron-sulfur subunit